MTRSSFAELLRYLYLDVPPRVSAADCGPLLALGDRLCLPRFVRLTEAAAVADLASRSAAFCSAPPGDEDSDSGDGDSDHVSEDALRLLQLCQLHGAEQLASWCLAHLAQNYDRVCRRYPKALRNLYPENQAWLNINRWPPVWYIKDYDYHKVSLSQSRRNVGSHLTQMRTFQRLVMEQEREERLKNLKRLRNGSSSSSSSSSALVASSFGLRRGVAAASKAGEDSGCLCFATKSRRANKDRG